MNKYIITFSILLYAIAVPILEINDTHVFNPDWTPHVRIHEVWQLITNSGIGLLCLWLVWVKKETKISTLLSMLITGGFLLAFALKELYGGSMKYLDGSEKTLFGINIGIVGFGIAFVLLLSTFFQKKTLPKQFLFLALLVFLGSCRTQKTEIQLTNGLVIENARIISPEDQALSPESYIVINGDSIVYIGTDKPNLIGHFKTIDATGKYIIPGLIDSHVHVTGTDALSDEEELQNPEIVTTFKEQLPKSYLYFGYTTLIDLGTAKPERLADFQKAEIRPDLYFAGGGAVIGNGYGLSNWNDEIPNFIYQENEDYPIPEKYVKENHTPKAVAERIAASGAIVLKTYYEPGFDPTQPPFPTPSKELMAEIRQEAHNNNLVLAVHGNSLEAHDFLGQAQVDVIAHGLWNWGNHRLDSTKAIPEEIKKVLDTEIENKVGYMATLQVINGLNALTNPDFLNDPELEHVLPRVLIEYYKSNVDGMYANVFGGAPKNIIAANFNRISNQGKTNLKYMYDHGGNILFGTDTPSSPTYGNPPGYNGYLEMLEMEQAAIPLGKILAMATIENAKAFKLDKDFGTIETGKKANLLILNKNPLEDITAYNSIEQVVIHGVSLSRKMLSAKEIQE